MSTVTLEYQQIMSEETANSVDVALTDTESLTVLGARKIGQAVQFDVVIVGNTEEETDACHPRPAPLACGHPQGPPTAEEIDGCLEVIVRRCVVCERELWWNFDQWRKF